MKNNKIMQDNPRPYPSNWLISKDQAKDAAAIDERMRGKIREVLAKDRLKEASPKPD